VTAQRRERALAAARRHRPALAELRADALTLGRHARGLLDQLRRDPGLADDHLVGVRSRLGLAGDVLAQAADELAGALRVADRVAAVLGDSSLCGLPWSVCPACLGQALASSGRWSRCQRCRRRWPDLEVEPCPWPAAATVTDRGSGRLRLCASHATDAAGRLAGGHVAWDRGGGEAQ
jgi:hypothetical protein